MDGFYIGRYEVGDGDLISRNSSSGTSSTPVEMQGKYVYNNIYWYGAYDICKRLSGSSETVRSCLIYGCLWDATLEYLVKCENRTYYEIAIDSASFGNYMNITLEYTNISGSSETKKEGSTTTIPTGSSEYTNTCNIYDLAGNCWEYSQEVRSVYGIYLRGGNTYDHDTAGVYCPVSSRGYGGSNSMQKYGGNGCRAILYIK